jgi:rhodanese-related sulfurtransferase
VARELMAAGYEDVHALHGGFDAWREAGGAVEKK